MPVSTAFRRIDPAHLVVLTGVGCALHIGKLPAALPVLREAVGVTLVQAGFLLSLVQLAGMLLGLGVGLLADRQGARRVMLCGLTVLSLGSLLGSVANTATFLLATRALEGLGFLLAVLPAPALIRQMVREPDRLSRGLGLWGAYMPLGTAMALLLVPMAVTYWGWQAVWLFLALVSGAQALWLARGLPAVPAPTGAPAAALWSGLRQTLGDRGPWVVALAFSVYSGQWLSVIGFLPTVYVQAGVTGGSVGVLTALASAVNMIGNIVAGRLLARGWQPRTLLYIGFAAMGAGTWIAFGSDAPGWVRYLAILMFSCVGGMIPGTLFSMAVRLAPGPGTVSATVGWVQQWSALGQFVGPPLVAWVATRSGGWHHTWWVTGACCVAGAVLAVWIGRLLRQRQA